MNEQMIEKKALMLPEAARVQLAEKLLASLDTPPEAEIETLWLDEAELRAAQIDNGQVTMVSSDAAAKEIQELLA